MYVWQIIQGVFGMRFSNFGQRTVFSAFDGGEITSDAGILLLRERAQQIDLFSRMACCFEDHRDHERTRHSLTTLLAQRVCGIALGYEDVNDHDHLRHDPVMWLHYSGQFRQKISDLKGIE